MENVICSCLNCGSELGAFRNAWMGIGNSYYSPIYAPLSHRHGFVATGEVFAKGADGSAVQNSVLQDLACKQCFIVVGLRCDEAPNGHLLKKNQLILRLSEMKVVSEHSGAKANIVVEEKIPLLPPGVKNPSTFRRTASVQPQVRAERSGSLVVYGKPQSMNNAMPPPPRNENSGGNLTNFATWAETAINDQQKDIDRIGGAVARIEKDMRLLKEFLTEVRAELAANRETRKAQDDLTQDQAVWLKEDLKELRQDHENFRLEMKEDALPDIRNGSNTLKNSLMLIDSRFDDIEALKLDLRHVQKRLTDIEEKKQPEFVFPRMLVDATRPDRQAEGGSKRASAVPGTEAQPMFRAPTNYAISPVVPGQASPSPPGAFPKSIVEPEASQHSQAAEELGLVPHLPQTIAEVAQTLFPRARTFTRWVYAGPQRWQQVRDAFKAFGLEYPKLGFLSEKIKALEGHVQNSNLTESEAAKTHGKLISPQEHEANIQVQNSSVGRMKPARSKRKNFQDGATAQSSESPTKKRKGMTLAKQGKPIVPRRLESPTPQPQARVGSPELGRESLLRSVAASSTLFSSQADNTPAQHSQGSASKKQRSAGKPRKDIEVEMSRIPTAAAAEPLRIKSESYDELSGIAENISSAAFRGGYTLMPSIERDQYENNVPGSFPPETPLRRG